MLKIMLLIILSPLVILCGIVSVSIIYVIVNVIIEMVINCIKTIKNRDDNQC